MVFGLGLQTCRWRATTVSRYVSYLVKGLDVAKICENLQNRVAHAFLASSGIRCQLATASYRLEQTTALLIKDGDNGDLVLFMDLHECRFSQGRAVMPRSPLVMCWYLSHPMAMVQAHDGE